MLEVVFIIGSPRSGTTLLENILGCHPEIAEWYEPYYVWERYFSCKENDVWLPREPTEATKFIIKNEYRIFQEKSRKSIILDKSPQHAYNIPAINSILPEAKWIHMVRDGRDVTLSIRKEWSKRKQVVEKRDIRALFGIGLTMLKRQPFRRYKLMAILHELRSIASLNPVRYLNKSRWDGQVGWGPRFEGWKEFLQTHSLLQFNAMQWVKSVEAVRQSGTILSDANKLEIRYEDLLRHPPENLYKIMDFMGIRTSVDFFESIPKIRRDNLNKWKIEFTPQEIAQIKPVLNPMLEKLGYLDQEAW